MTKESEHESTHIITHKYQFTQPNFLEFPKETQIRVDSYTNNTNIYSEVQQQAFSLYDIGLNVFPLPLGKKGGYPWKKLQYTRLDRNNEQYGLQVLFAGQCNIGVMCGRTSQNLFVIDCESKETLQYQIQQMRKRNIPLWVSETKRGGHIYLFSADGEVQNIPSGIMNDVEIKGCNGYVLAPPSTHPSLKQYTWIEQEGNKPPIVHINQIDWLYDTYNNSIKLSAQKSKPINNVKTNHKIYFALSRRTQSYIQDGHTIKEGSRNNELFSASCDMAGNSYSEQNTFNILFPQAHASGLSANEIRTTIKSAFSQPRTPSNPKNNNNKNKSDWKWAILYADNHEWVGRNATSKRAIFTALIHRAKVASNEDGLFRASIREIATLARAGTATVQRVLKEFQNPSQQYIIKCGYDKTSQATLWKFPQKIIKQAQKLNIDTLKESPQWLSCSVSVLSLPDCVERSGLGYNGLLVYRAMVDYGKPIMPKELVALTRLADHQVKYVLKKLSIFELIHRENEGWVAESYDDALLDRIVDAKKSVIGKAEKRSQRFARERSIFAGRHLFYARLRRERDAFKIHTYGVMRQYYDMKYQRTAKQLPPIFKEVCYDKRDQPTKIFRRVPLSEVDDDDIDLIEFALSLGAEIYIEAE